MKKADIIKEALKKHLMLLESKTSLLQENVKIYKTTPKDGEYMVLISSNLGYAQERDKETAGMGWQLSLTKGNEAKFRNRYDFNPPVYWKGENGRFGWGYKITAGMGETEVAVLVNRLKELVHDYNDKKKIEFDLSTQQLTPEQIELINKIVDTVQVAGDENAGTDSGRNLDKYLEDLQNAIEDDKVFDFLVDTFEKVKSFQRKNLSFYKYSFLNSLIIRYADPQAIYAAPRTTWEAKGYGIKPEIKHGIIIQKMGTKKDTTWDNANWFKGHMIEWDEYKKYASLPMDISVESYLKDGGRQAAYSLASFGLERRFFSNTGSFTTSYTYTDTMIEPIPGKEQVPLDNDEFMAKEEPIESLELRGKIDAIFNAVSKIADREKISILGVKRADGDINQLNILLNKILYSRITQKYDFMLKDKTKARETEEILKAYAEAVSHMVRKYFGLPAEASKFNIAGFGVDRENLKKRSNALLNMANHFIDEIEDELRVEGLVAETRKMVRKIIKENIKL